MALLTKTIGLSLGADLCWPACYEEIVRRLKLRIPAGDDAIAFQIERLTVEPFDLQQPCSYDVVLDRLTHWFAASREWIKKAVLLDGLYVLNNPWSLQAMEKHTSYAAMMKLGMPVPRTWMIPPKEYAPSADLKPTLERYARLFDLGSIGRELGFPLYMKPYDGGAWVGVTRIDNEDALRAAYEQSGTRVMHLQQAVEPYDLFVRCIGCGPQVHVVRYDPSAALHDRYKVDFHFVDGDEWSLLTDTCLTINAFFGWEFNSCEALRGSSGVFHPIDFANACPDFQVTSLHYHFPEMVKNMVRWSIFCAATERKMPASLDWTPFFEIAKRDLPYRERLRAYAKIARQRMQADAFAEFCHQHLGHLNEVVWEFFGSQMARDCVHAKVASLFPDHEVEQFTEHFWGLIQFWRKTEGERLNLPGAAT
ncbi:MAG: ATP-grasp domain-containing protein [Nannocystaceae bacterium]